MFDGFFEDTDTSIISDSSPKKIDRTLLRVWNPDSFILSKAQRTFARVFELPRLASIMGILGKVRFSKQTMKEKAAESIKLFKVHGWKSAKILNISSVCLKENSRYFQPAINKISRNVNGIQRFEADLKLSQQTTDEILHNFEAINNGIAKHFVNLKQLKLCLVDSDSFDEKRFKDFLRPVFRGLAQLEYLEIRFKRVETKDAKVMKVFGKSIAKYLPRLKDLRIQFERKRTNTITDSEVQVLVSEIGKSRGQLRVLSLEFIDFENCIQGKNFQGLFSNSLFFASLKALKLRFYDCGTNNDIALQQFGLAFGPDLKNLEELHLNLESSSYKLSGEKLVHGFQTLVTNICRNLKNLKSFTMKLKPIGVNDQDLKILASEIYSLQNLQDLSLSFGSIMLISSEALKLPSEIAVCLPTLNHFEFQLKSSSQNIKLDDFVSLAQNIAQCKVKWETFNLSLFQPVGIDIQPKIKQILSFIPNLKIEI